MYRQEAKNWITWDKNEYTRIEVELMLKNNDDKELEKCFESRLKFGTAGLRARMGPGTAQINDLVILQTNMGIIHYLKEIYDVKDFQKGIIVGFDGRYNSKRFAQLTANIFLQNCFKVYLFEDYAPTPFIPLGVKKYGCLAGIMVTASHNPKDDNGFKLYWGNGAQIIPPIDKNIQECILKNLIPKDSYWDLNNLDEYKNTLRFCDDDILEDYLNHLKTYKCIINGDKLNIPPVIYTAMHGVGYKVIKKAFEMFNVELLSVSQQQEPDPEFSTVKFPNPEEGEETLKLALELGNSYPESTLLLANDPDADRLAIAEKISHNKWYIFSGNEIGALLGWWSMEIYKTKNKTSDLSKTYMLYSTVSSSILKSIALKENFNSEETLTGFKWMGNRAHELSNKGQNVIFAFEEAIGFMCGNKILDKDGISAAINCVFLNNYLHSQNMTLRDKLNDIYQTYGYHQSLNTYFKCSDISKIKTIFDRLRNFEGTNKYPTKLNKCNLEIIRTRDLTAGYDSAEEENKPALPISKSTQMITFYFNNNLNITLRTSGTEPKLKYYSEICSETLNEIQKILQDVLSSVIDEFLKPELDANDCHETF